MTFIQDLLGEKGPQDGPMAELWMGAHPGAPSEVFIEGTREFLNGVIEKCPEGILGKTTSEKFHNTLPFLFKVLAVEQPLSVQVHPNVEKARAGLERENRLGIPLSADNRNYKDPNHKPELLCALSAFELLCGFREMDELLLLIEGIVPPNFFNERAIRKREVFETILREGFNAFMKMDRPRQQWIAREVTRWAAKRALENPAYDWVVKLHEQYPGDIGVLSPLLLNFMRLKPGEAVFLPPGTPHAYLGGFAMEIMANSDNVVRGGLTKKHVDLAEFLNTVSWHAGAVTIVEPVQTGTSEISYPTKAEEFLLSVIRLKGGESFTSARARSVEILLCQCGEAEARDMGTGSVIPLSKGKVILVPAATIQYRLFGSGTFYKASVPL